VQRARQDERVECAWLSLSTRDRCHAAKATAVPRGVAAAEAGSCSVSVWVWWEAPVWHRRANVSCGGARVHQAAQAAAFPIIIAVGPVQSDGSLGAHPASWGLGSQINLNAGGVGPTVFAGRDPTLVSVRLTAPLSNDRGFFGICVWVCGVCGGGGAHTRRLRPGLLHVCVGAILVFGFSFGGGGAVWVTATVLGGKASFSVGPL
jgi:hypothetical protein